MYKNIESAAALSGVATCAIAVQQVAVGTGLSDEKLNALISTLFTFEAESVEAVYQHRYAALLEGADYLDALLRGDKNKAPKNLSHYLFSLIYLAQRLRKDKKISTEVFEQLKRAEQQAQLLGKTHPQLIGTIGASYQDIFGRLKTRIRVPGNSTTLSQPYNQALIRTLLLCGIRSALLWHQTGGRLWHLLLKKNHLRQGLIALRHHINAQEVSQCTTSL
jgi:high frequency lysogenization protein